MKPKYASVLSQHAIKITLFSGLLRISVDMVFARKKHSVEAWALLIEVDESQRVCVIYGVTGSERLGATSNLVDGDNSIRPNSRGCKNRKWTMFPTSVKQRHADRRCVDYKGGRWQIVWNCRAVEILTSMVTIVLEMILSKLLPPR